MSLINKEKVLNGVGKAVDVTNKAADKASSFVKEKKIDKKAMKAAKTAEKGIKIAGRLERLQEKSWQVIKVRREVLLLQAAQHQISL